MPCRVTERFQVADTRDIEPMQVQYVGEEEVETGQGFLRASICAPAAPGRRPPPRRDLAGRAARLMPVQLRQTEPDGTQIDLIYRGSEAAAGGA